MNASTKAETLACEDLLIVCVMVIGCILSAYGCSLFRREPNDTGLHAGHAVVGQVPQIRADVFYRARIVYADARRVIYDRTQFVRAGVLEPLFECHLV